MIFKFQFKGDGRSTDFTDFCSRVWKRLKSFMFKEDRLLRQAPGDDSSGGKKYQGGLVDGFFEDFGGGGGVISYLLLIGGQTRGDKCRGIGFVVDDFQGVWFN